MIQTTLARSIRLLGVRQNNLKNIDVSIPLGKLTVVTGVSGSGKSSLAFDVLYAEGQRRYVETFSAYTRQFLERMAKPQADLIEGVPAAVAIDQSGAIKTSRSTVGTMTGINDYLKVLYSRLATPYCPDCDTEVAAQDTAAVVAAVRELPAAAFPAMLVAGVPLGGFESLDIVRQAVRSQGYSRFLRDGAALRLDELAHQDLEADELEVVVDRLSSPRVRDSRVADSADQTFRLGRGSLRLVPTDGASRAFHEGLRCGGCGREFPRPGPGLFSFNSPYGACAECRGFGRVIDVDFRRVVPDPSLSLRQGAIKPWTSPSRRRFKSACLRFCDAEGIPTNVPFGELDPDDQHKILEGHDGYPGVRGFFDRLEQKKYKMHVRVLLSRYRGYFECPECRGRRLRPEAFCFRVDGRDLAELWQQPIHELRAFFSTFTRRRLDRATALIVGEIASRLDYLDAVGLGYLTLDRQSRTLSGGEVQRVNLTTALGASLVETLFVLDEPSIGLHARDNARLVEILRAIRDRGNTVVVVEHDPEILQAADHVIDLGPGAGAEGGEVVAAGSLSEIAGAEGSLTAAYLSGKRRMPAPRKRRDSGVASLRTHSGAERQLSLRNARAHNLKGIDVTLPLRRLVVISGVSGSGKSTLVETVLHRAARRALGQPVEGAIELDAIEGLEFVDDVVLVDQSPLGRTSRGNPATYIKVFGAVRDRFAATPGARAARFDARHFSFNVSGGRCEECAGAGAIDVEMQFLSDVSLPCEACDGKRFREEVLEIRYRGLSIHQTLELTIRQAVEHFDGDPEIVEPLIFLDGLGLGYLRLGQPLNTLSGGEAQRLKLASRVLASRRQKLLFLLDEPTTGLHLADVERLIEVLQGLVEAGHSVVVIEHHLDVLRAADWLIDLGPEGGERGGEVVAAGSPATVAADASSVTGRWLARETFATGTRGGRSAGRKRSGPGESVAPRFAGARGGQGEARALRETGRNGEANCIRVVGARENNLRDIDVDLPRDRFVVVTGMSGSGKSSLLYDIVHAEGQRRFLDCLSPYARQFVEELHRPDIDHLEGIPPTVAIEQRTTIGGRKSTVGTVTEIYQFLRLLFTRVGEQYCPDCDVAVVPRSVEEIRAVVAARAADRGRLLAPAVRGKKGFHNTLFERARRLGISEARIDGAWRKIPRDRELRLDRHRAHDVDLVVGDFRSPAGTASSRNHRVRDAVDLGLELGDGVVVFVATDGEETVLNRHRSCPGCERDFAEPDPRNFSFNSRHGACAACGGFGCVVALDPELLVSDWKTPLSATRGSPLAALESDLFPKSARRRFLKECSQAGIDTSRPLFELAARDRKAFFQGRRGSGFDGLRGFAESYLEQWDDETADGFRRRHGVEKTCPRCRGSRLRGEWAAVRVGGHGIAELAQATVEGLRESLARMPLRGRRQKALGEPIVEEILARLRFLEELGLGYLGVGRRVDTLSGGEAQRIRLAAQLGSNLRGVCYILDEPTIGLHASDNRKLIGSLRRLRDRGNSVLVIEHDEDTIAAADHVVDIGPGPGRLGGRVVAEGSFEQIVAAKRSTTGEYFRQREGKQPRLSHAEPGGPWISVRGAHRHNLRDVDVRFPLGAVTVVCGVSGAGKSTLVREILEANLRRRLQGRARSSLGCRSVAGAGEVVAVREVDQRPIGRSPRSTPATYVGVWNAIRKVFASTPLARTRGFGAARFSFNVGGGRCEACAGQGQIKMEMNFLPDVRVDCDRCRGERFNAETLKVTYRGKTIGEVLDMEVAEARELFSTYREIARPLDVLIELGLGYLTLGQASTTLSGGEAQRVKLAVELSKSTAGGKALYILDEPTTGLHLVDVDRLSATMRRLAGLGHAVVVIEHHLDLVAGADWVVELGPGGGELGGRLVYQGPPAGLLDRKLDTPTSRCLQPGAGHAPVTSK